MASSFEVAPSIVAQSSFSNPVGTAPISWPDGQFDEALVDISKLGYHGIQMLGWTEQEEMRIAHSRMADRATIA